MSGFLLSKQAQYTNGRKWARSLRNAAPPLTERYGSTQPDRHNLRLSNSRPVYDRRRRARSQVTLGLNILMQVSERLRVGTRFVCTGGPRPVAEGVITSLSPMA